MSPAQLRIRAAVRFLFLTTLVGLWLVLAHAAAAVAFMAAGL